MNVEEALVAAVEQRPNSRHKAKCTSTSHIFLDSLEVLLSIYA
jgi:hypothetical protein